MQHPDEGTIHSWLDGALSADEAAEIEAHVAACPQCAAAVAEARGFIAGASRILTALDSVPSGVVPAARTVKTRNWAVWRAAAAIFVVALGSFVVLKDRLVRTQGDAAKSTGVSTEMRSKPFSASAMPAQEGTKPQLDEKTNMPAATQMEQKPSLPAATGIALASGANGGTSDSRVDERRASVSNKIREIAPSPATAALGAAAPAGFSQGGAVAAMDAASATMLPREVGSRKETAGTSTFYEVSPGDTVVLTDGASESRVGSVVVTSGTEIRSAAPSRTPSPTSPMTKAATPDSQERTAQSQAQSTNQVAAPAAPTAAARMRVSGASNAYNTITWIDPRTRRVMKLSGRHSKAELEEIRQRIERARAVQSDKKTP